MGGVGSGAPPPPPRQRGFLSETRAACQSFASHRGDVTLAKKSLRLMDLKKLNLTLINLFFSKKPVSKTKGPSVVFVSGIFERNQLTQQMKILICQMTTARSACGPAPGAAGPRGHIPALYLAALQRFWAEVRAARQPERVALWEWAQEGWTFHAGCPLPCVGRCGAVLLRVFGLDPRITTKWPPPDDTRLAQGSCDMVSLVCVVISCFVFNRCFEKVF